MDKFVVKGGKKLSGEIRVSGAKNVAMKIPIVGILSDKRITVSNVPHISSVFGTCEMMKSLGVKVTVGNDHSMTISGEHLKGYKVPLEMGGRFRTATMVMGPLLARFGRAVVPNPGGCRLGKRPIDRHIDGLRKMGAKVTYKDGYFYAEAAKLHGTTYRFPKSTHTGTEAMILASVLAQGETVLENAAEEPEIDDLITLLTRMGANIHRNAKRTIVILGVSSLHGAEFDIMPDRNEVVTFAIGAIATGGNILIDGVVPDHLEAFFQSLVSAGAKWKHEGNRKTRFIGKSKLTPTHIKTNIHPGFMTDWQAPWAILMTQAIGESTIHETIYEDRFGYVEELRKMGAFIEFFHPKIKKPREFYGFNWEERKRNFYHAVRIHGPTQLHDAVLQVCDLRAGATLVLAGLLAQGESIIYGIDQIDRGYEVLDKRLSHLGASIKRVQESEL